MYLYSIGIILYILVFIFLVWRNLKWAVFVTVFLLPSYMIRFSVGTLPMTMLEVMILLMFLVWLIRNRFKFKISKSKVFNVLVILFLIAATVAMFVGPDLRSAAGIWKAYFIEPILFLMIFVSVIKKDDFRYLFNVLGVQVLVLSFYAILQKFLGWGIRNPFWAAEETRRVISVFEYPNALALYLAPVVVMMIGRIKDFKLQIWNILYWLSIVSGTIAIYFTKSKGAMIGLVAGIVFYTLFNKGYKKIFVPTMVVVILVGGVLMGSVKIDLKGMATVEGGDSITTRVEMWGETWKMLQTKPILGAGLSGYQAAVAPYHKKDYIEIYLYPHNIVFNFWSEIGLFGLLAFVGFLVWFFVFGFKNKDSVVFMSGMSVLLVHGLVDVPYFKNDLSVLFWLIVGLVLINSREKANNNV